MLDGDIRAAALLLLLSPDMNLAVVVHCEEEKDIFFRNCFWTWLEEDERENDLAGCKNVAEIKFRVMIVFIRVECFNII